MAYGNTPPISHREQKKAKTRGALIEVSQRLFAEQGYAATTLEEICVEVDIRPQTLLRYFESKAHLANAPITDPLNELRRYVEDPARTMSTLAVWREYMKLEANEVMAPSSAALTHHVHNMREFRKWVDKDPVLVAMQSDIERRLREWLATSIAKDEGAGPHDLHSTLLAGLLVVGRTAVYEKWLSRRRNLGALLDDQMAMIDYAVKSLPRRSAEKRLASMAD